MYRYRWLQRLLFVPATRGGKMMATLQQRTRKYNPDGSKRPGLVKRVTNWNKVPAKPPPLTPEMTRAVARGAPAGRGAPVAPARPRPGPLARRVIGAAHAAPAAGIAGFAPSC